MTIRDLQIFELDISKERGGSARWVPHDANEQAGSKKLIIN